MKLFCFTIDVVFAVATIVLVTFNAVKAEMLFAYDHHSELLAEVELANRTALAEYDGLD
jgi:hypothetical protein